MAKLTWLATAVAVLSCALAAPVCAIAEISEQIAIESAHKAIAKYGVTPSRWTFYVEKDLQRWQDIKSWWQERSIRERRLGLEDTDFGPWLAQMESMIEG